MRRSAEGVCSFVLRVSACANRGRSLFVTPPGKVAETLTGTGAKTYEQTNTSSTYLTKLPSSFARFHTQYEQTNSQPSCRQKNQKMKSPLRSQAKKEPK